MGDIGTKLTPDAIALLKFNYEKLHETVWDNHKISWTVTSLYCRLSLRPTYIIVSTAEQGSSSNDPIPS